LRASFGKLRGNERITPPYRRISSHTQGSYIYVAPGFSHGIIQALAQKGARLM
jgi:hypothetical protein